MDEQLQGLGLTATWVTAVDSQAVGWLPNGTLVSKTAHACWLSHVAVLTRIADECQRPAVVLEDDAVLDRKIHWPSFFGVAPRSYGQQRTRLSATGIYQ